MPRKNVVHHPDDLDVELAPVVTPEQLAALEALGYRGAWPSTAAQAAAILERLQQSLQPPQQARQRDQGRGR